MPYRKHPLVCPSCNEELVEQDVDGIGVAACATCSGLWIELSVFFSAMKDAQPQMKLTELMVHNDGSPRRPCAACKEPMDIAWIDFLQLDQCEPHGVWFDAGELDRALARDVVPDEIKRVAKMKPVARDKDGRPIDRGGYRGG